MSLISKLYNIYIKKASIENDMANRIMYSLITSNASPNELYYSDRIVNEGALDLAVQGIDNIIKYGSISVLDELKYLDEDRLEYNNIDFNEIKKDIENNKYSSILIFLKKATSLFVNEYFDDDFGGYPWSIIAKSLYNLTNLKINLLNEKDKKKQNEIKKLIILEMNHFDSLAHNNGSILEKMVKDEESASDIEDVNKKIKEYYKKINILKQDLKYIKDKYPDILDLHKNIDSFDLNNESYTTYSNFVKSIINFTRNYTALRDSIKYIPNENDSKMISADIDNANEVSEIILDVNSESKIERVYQLMDAKDSTNPDFTFSVLKPYAMKNKLQFRDALNIFNKNNLLINNPEEYRKSQDEMTLTRLKRSKVIDRFINDLKSDVKNSFVNYYNNFTNDVFEIISKYNISNGFKEKINIINNQFNKTNAIARIIIDSGAASSNEFESHEKFNDYINNVKFLISILEAFIL